MQRNLLGLLAAALLALSAALWIFPAPGSELRTLIGVFLRLGLVLGAMWLAIPNVVALASRLPKWLLAATFVGLVIVAVRPPTILIVGPILLALWALAPHWGRTRRKR